MNSPVPPTGRYPSPGPGLLDTNSALYRRERIVWIARYTWLPVRRRVNLLIMTTPLRKVIPVRKLPLASSLLLDVVRFGASILVAFGHLTQAPFSIGWRDWTVHAVESVAIFFVLSGFVIRYVTRLKYAEIREYWVDRASRIYSVTIPAMVFTIAVDLIAHHANPHYYMAWWSGDISRPWLRIVTNLTFTSQVWSKSYALFSNGPFWSLSYECFYYVIYGCAFYLMGVRRLFWVGVIVLVGGIHIFLLLPLWLLGCALYEIYARLSGRGGVWAQSLGFAAVGIVGWMLWSPVVRMIFAAKDHLTLLFLAHGYRPINLHWILDYYRVGVPGAFLLLWLLLIADRVRLDARSRSARAVRLLAEGTFPLYLFHFPVYVLIAALVPYDHANPWFKWGMLLIAATAGVLLARPTDALKRDMRDGLRRRFIPADPMPEARSVETV